MKTGWLCSVCNSPTPFHKDGFGFCVLHLDHAPQAEVWTQEDIDEAKRKAKELHEYFHPPAPRAS